MSLDEVFVLAVSYSTGKQGLTSSVRYFRDGFDRETSRDFGVVNGVCSAVPQVQWIMVLTKYFACLHRSPIR